MESHATRVPSPQARSSLISNITPEDPIPSEWRPERGRRMSADDITRIEILWERHYGIENTEYSKVRAFSEPILNYSPVDPINALTSLSVRQSGQPLRTPSTDSAQKKNSTSLWETGKFLLSGQWLPGCTSFGQVHETPTPDQQDGIQTGLENMIQLHLEPCRTVLGLIAEILKFLWWVFRWPVTGILTVIALAAIVVWVVAAFYTLTSNAFLNTFCELKLPLIRDMVCSGYDLSLRQLLQPKDATDFHAEFGTMFEDKNIGTAISLPYYLSKWQTEFRWLRSNLPSSKLSAWDEQFFRDTLTASIERSRDTVVFSQKTFAHMYGTVEFIVSGTAVVVRSLNETGFPSGAPMQLESPCDNKLTIGMEWLHSKWLVVLPYGVEPFRESRGQPMLNGITRMRVFVQGVIERLRKDQEAILTLRGLVDGQVEISDRLTTEAVRCVSENHEAKVLRGHRGWYAFLDMIGYTDPKDWIIQQRLQALESMKPVYREQSDYLSKASVQLGSVLQACESLEDSLFAQQIAIQRGMSPSDWLFEQPKVLEKGREKMVKELEVWNMRKTEANTRIFEHFG